LANDPATGQLVLFGGQESSEFLGDTWTWNGTTWAQQSPAASPAARKDASMAYDTGSGQLVFFGGTNSGGDLNHNFGDTWTWNDVLTTSVLSPSTGTTLSGSTDLDASASDATSVQFRIFGGIYGLNGTTVCTATATTNGWSCAWNTTEVPDDYYTLSSEAFNSAGSASSSGVAVRVNNTNSLPTTSVVLPSNGAALQGSTYLDATASNAASVEFRIFGGVYGFDGPVLCTATATLYGWLCRWNSATVPNGSYVLSSEAFNPTGGTLSSGISITVNN
jgi:hypothetical protein